MGPIKPTSTRFRPYGTHHHLSVLGQVSTTLVAESGAQHKTTVFIIEGHQIEPLLGDADAKSLGILCINPEGKTKKGSEMVTVKVVTSDLQAAGFTLNTCLEQDEEPTAAEKQRVEEILAYHASVFEGIGLLNDDVAKFHVDPDIPPVAAPYRPVPLAYREKLNKHLQELRDNNKIGCKPS